MYENERVYKIFMFSEEVYQDSYEELHELRTRNDIFVLFENEVI